MTLARTLAAAASFLAGMTGTAAGGGQAHPNVQPTLCVNYIVRLV